MSTPTESAPAWILVLLPETRTPASFLLRALARLARSGSGIAVLDGSREGWSAGLTPGGVPLTLARPFTPHGVAACLAAWQAQPPRPFVLLELLGPFCAPGQTTADRGNLLARCLESIGHLGRRAPGLVSLQWHPSRQALLAPVLAAAPAVLQLGTQTVYSLHAVHSLHKNALDHRTGVP